MRAHEDLRELKPRRDNALPLMPFKAEAPPISAYAVMRDEIADRVFAASGIRLVLVRGPAGFGKTTVLLQLRQRYAREGVPCAWLNIDEADSDLPRFLLYLEAALDPLLQSPDQGASEADRRGSAVPLLERVAAHGKPFALFLDECEHIRNASVTAFVTQLIDALPAGAVLVVGTRGIPTIGLARLRARGQLLEIEPAQLRFSDAEAAEFLGRRGVALSPDQIRYLHRTTEGWAAALWLASVALESRADAERVIAGVTGSNAVIADYLAEDVLARQDESMREFLLKTSLLEILTAPLCDAVCGRSGSAEMLRRVERANLFLAPLDEQRSSYRYHGLFAEFLRTRLQSRRPEWVSPICRAAAAWYLDQGRWVPAVDYLLKAGDLETALSLIERQADELQRKGRLRLLARWLDAVPTAALDTRPRLKLSHAWAVTFTRGAQEALTMAQAMEGLELHDAAAQAELLALRPMLLGQSDRVDEAHAMALERLPHIDPQFSFARSMALQTLANTSMILGQFRAAGDYADQGRRAQGAAASEFSLSLADAVEGSMNLMQGRLRHATALLQRAAGAGRDGEHAGRNAFVGVLLAEALYEGGDNRRAERLLQLYLPMVQELRTPDQLILAHALLARIADARGEADAALRLLGELEQIGLRHPLPRVVASARVERARHFARLGDAAGAREQLTRAADEDLWRSVASRCYIANDLINRPMATLRWLTCSGAAEQAAGKAKALLEEAEHAQMNRRVIKLRILMAEALCRDGQRKAAVRVLEKAVVAAAEEGFVSTFVEEGPVIQGILTELLEARGADGDAPLNDALLKRVTQGSQPMQRKDVVEMQAGKIDILTLKEIQVLEMLAQGYSNNAIGEKLFVSESTVRTHLRNINSKLQTRSRTQALATARGMGLIP